MRIAFRRWFCDILDRYDWDYSEYLTVLNPDFASKLPGAVRPQDREFTVFHSNAKRLEDAKLAPPYDVASAAWPVITPELISPAVIAA